MSETPRKLSTRASRRPAVVREADERTTGSSPVADSPVGVLDFLQRTVGNRAVNDIVQSRVALRLGIVHDAPSLASPAPARGGPLPASPSPPVIARRIQRQDDDSGDDDTVDTNDQSSPATTSDGGTQPTQQQNLQPVSQQVPLSPPTPIPVKPSDVGSGLGDYELPDESDTVMAKRLDNATVIQRDDDDAPQLGPDYSVGGTGTVVSPPNNPRTGTPPTAPAPWTMSSTIVYRNFNLYQIPRLHLDFGHEPSLQLQIDPSSGLSAQAAIALINYHWMPPWNHEVELSLSPFVQTTLSPLALSQVGVQGQAEQHVTGTLSITLSVSGSYQPPQPGQDGGLNVSAGAGVLLHWDWDKL